MASKMPTLRRRLRVVSNLNIEKIVIGSFIGRLFGADEASTSMLLASRMRMRILAT